MIPNWLKWWRGERPLTPRELASITEAIDVAPQGIVAENPAGLSRRGFLKLIAPAAAGFVLAPTLLEELLAPQRTYFLPPASAWTVNSLGGYLYSRELAKVLRQSVQPLVKFREQPSILGPDQIRDFKSAMQWHYNFYPTFTGAD